MKILFLDDSCRHQTLYTGLGGFAVEEKALIPLREEFVELKTASGLRPWTEVKWSPPAGGEFKAKLKVSRHEFYTKCFDLLQTHNATVFAAVHSLKDCYGIRDHGWDKNRALLWAAKQELRYIAERFERPYLAKSGDVGLIVCDQYSSYDDEAHILQAFSWELLSGTGFEQLQHIATAPLPANSFHCSFLQLADLVIGVLIGALAKSKYAIALFSRVARLMLLNPHDAAVAFSSLPSAAVMGFGLKLMPQSFHVKGLALFADLDRSMIVNELGWKLRAPIRTQERIQESTN